MTCKCSSNRIMKLSGKCSDMASYQIPHANLDIHGSVPYLGIFGGDYISFNVCLDCGQIQKWIPVSDEDIEEMLE